MKNSFFKIGLITALNVSAGLRGNDYISSLPSKPLIVATCVNRNAYCFSHFLALGTNENLKAYHIGLQFIFPGYQIPSAQDLLSAIRSHSQFIGFLSQSEAQARLQIEKKGYFIFEEKGNTPGHFYIAYSERLRHFTVNKGEVAGIDNGHSLCYPGLNSFLQSTFAI